MSGQGNQPITENPDEDQWARLRNAVADMRAGVEQQKKAVAGFQANMLKLEVSVGELKSSLITYQGDLGRIQTHGKRLRGQMRRLISTVDPWTGDAQEMRPASYQRAA